MIDIIVDEGIAAEGEEPLPANERIEQAVREACLAAGLAGEPELCIRFAGDTAVHELNRQWRGKDCPTDVLSFPMQEGPDFDAGESLGDIIIAVPYSVRAAAGLSLSSTGHMLHLTVHGTLHLLGYDHIEDEEAERMHRLEREVMRRLGLHDPYPEEETELDDAQ